MDTSSGTEPGDIFFKAKFMKNYGRKLIKQYYKKNIYIQTHNSYSPYDENGNFDYDSDINKNSKINTGSRTVLPYEAN